ncbi:MAG TPA: sugar kinase, partial [Rhodospirillales bacterium]|nr:sugar kinase [Rhodospirillales bacterium]
MPDSAAILAIGGLHFDTVAQGQAPVQMKASNPVRCHRFVGGVAHNIACDMAALGTRSCLMSLVGQDADGDGVIAETTKRGVDLALVARSPTVKTASYTAVLEPDGELAIGLSDSQ